MTVRSDQSAHPLGDKDPTNRSLRDALARRRERQRDAQTNSRLRLDQLEERLAQEWRSVESQFSEWEKFQGELEEHQRGAVAEREQLARLAAKIDKRQADTETQRQQIAKKLSSQRRDALQIQDEAQEEIASVRRENQALTRQLDEANEQLELQRIEMTRLRSAAAAPVPAPQEPAPDLSEHLEAIQELQAELERVLGESSRLREENDALQRRLVAARETKRVAPRGKLKLPGVQGDGDGNNSQDWESQKRRLLEQLEDESSDERSDEDGEGEGDTEDYDTVAQELIQEQETRIRELMERLADAEGRVAAAQAEPQTSSDSRAAEVLDQDAVIAQERERLRALQAEWEEKARQAEVESAMERARNARMRAELENKVRDLEAKQQQFAQRGGSAVNKPERERRWLDHLSKPRDGK